MQYNALAQVYAQSLFDLARAAGGQAKIEEINDELEQVIELARANRSFRGFLDSPIIEHERRRDSLRRLFDGRVTDLLLRFLLVLNEKGRLNQFEAIAGAYDQLVNEAFGRVEVDVYTAGRLGEEARAAISRGISHVLGKEPVLHTYTEEAMIGGVKLRIGDRFIDGSVATRLRRLKDAVLGGGAQVRGRLERFIHEGDASS